MTEPTTGDVLVIGEALIDVVRRPEVEPEEHPGGSPANVALTLGRLGRPTRLATWIADDDRGRRIEQWLADAGVDLVPGSKGAARTSVSAAALDPHGAATYSFDLDYRLPDAPPEVSRTIAVHTGSISAVLEPAATAVRELAAAARSRATITYDPNPRPSIMGDSLRTRRSIEALVSLADVVKVSDEDLIWLAPDDDPLDVARAWQKLGPALVVVTLGGDGAIGMTASREVHIRAPRVQVVDTVGAGDTFMGALIDGLWDAGLLGADRRDDLRSVPAGTLTALLERCTAIAAITVSRAGANPPTRAELPELPAL